MKILCSDFAQPVLFVGGSSDGLFEETMDIRDFTVCIIRCVYRAELILGT